jgi:hypothetical protein
MNRYQADLQDAIAALGDQLGKVQLLVRNLADCRAIADQDLDPETELALICWLREAAEITGAPQPRRRERPRS